MLLEKAKKYKGVSSNKLKNGDKTYYVTYKDSDNISRRKKVGKQSKGMTENKAFSLLQDLNQKKKHTDINQVTDKDSLIGISLWYFQQQITDRFGAVEAKYYLSEEFKKSDLYDAHRLQLNTFNYGLDHKRIDYYIEYLKGLQAFYPPLSRKILNYRKVLLKFRANVVYYHRTPLKDTNKRDINFLVTRLQAMGKSRKTISDVISMLRSIVNWAIDNDFYTGDNPFQGYKYIAAKKQRDRFLDREEVALLLERMKKENKNLYLCTYLGLITAGRANTVLNIQKKDINFKENIITLTNFKAKNRKYKLPLDDSSIAYFKTITQDMDRDDYLIQPTRKREYKKKPLYKIPPKFYAICDELFNEGIDKKIESENVVNFHTLRHTVASIMAIEGESIYKIKHFLDHSNIEETERYAKLRPNHLSSMVETYVAKNILI